MTTDDDVDPALEHEIFADAVSGLPLVQYEAGPIFLVGKPAQALVLGLVWLLLRALITKLLH